MDPYTLLVLLFVFTLLSNVVAIVTKQTIKDFLFKIIKTVFPNSDVHALIKLNTQLKEINHERNSISAQDNYARWTKLNRQYASLEKEAKTYENSIAAYQRSIDSKLNWLIMGVTTVPIQIIRIFYSRTPLLTLPAGVFPFYIEYLVNFPFLPRGTVGVVFISYSINTVLSFIQSLIQFLYFQPKVKKPTTESPSKQSQSGMIEEIDE